MLISETHFTDKSYFSIPKYITYLTNHPDNTAHGGTAILIKRTINHYELPQYKTNHIQATAIKVNMIRHELTVAAVYCPPKYSTKKEDFNDFFQTLAHRFIAGGDYNCKNPLWGSRLTTTRGRELSKTIYEQKYSQLSTGTPTYWPTDPNKIPDLLDFFVTKGIAPELMEVVPSLDLSSDHTPIIAIIGCEATHKSPRTKLHNKKTNWEEYRTQIQNKINLRVSLKTPREIDSALTTLVNTLKQATQDATPTPKIPSPNKRTVSIEIKKIIAEKRRARARWHRSHAPTDKTEYNHISNRLKSKIKEAKDKYFSDYISSLSRYDNTIWEPIKHLRKPTIPIPPIRNETEPLTPWARSDKEKAAMFSDYLATVFTPHDENIDHEIERQISEINTTIPEIKLVTVKDVQNEIECLNPRKAPGIDEVTPTMLKEMSRKGLVLLTYIFNAIIKYKYWPQQLKIAEIILILKPGKNPTSVSSYRPISLLPIISKILERLLQRRIRTDPNTKEWIPAHQFGFRENHSTVQQVHRITHKIYQSFENEEYCTAVFLDASQAFDKVWHPGLLYKIKKYLPITYFHILQSYLHGREFRTRVGDSTSNNNVIKSGVPQGSVLGPLLYLLYTADLPVNTKTTTGTFADDTVILSASTDPAIATSTLQQHLNQLQEWTKKWKIRINETKSVQVNFSLRREQCPPIYLNNTQIPVSHSAKYLGIHLDKHLTWREHIIKKRQQIDLKIKDLNWLIGRHSKLSLNNKILLYKAIIQPIWAYGAEIWGCASQTNIAILQRCQSKIIRMITNAPWYVSNATLHEDLLVPPIKEAIKGKSSRHFKKIEAHGNSLLQPLLEPRTGRRLKRKWPADLREG
jgi:hypothetical protein